MKKILLSLAAATILFSCSKKKETTGEISVYWRNTPWTIKSDSSFILLKDSMNYKTYSRKNEKLCIGTETMDSVRYTFYKGKLYTVIIYYSLSKVYHNIQVPKDSTKSIEETGRFGHNSILKYHGRLVEVNTDLSCTYDSVGAAPVNERKLIEYFSNTYGIKDLSHSDNLVWKDSVNKLVEEIEEVIPGHGIITYDETTYYYMVYFQSNYSIGTIVYKNYKIEEEIKDDIVKEQEAKTKRKEAIVKEFERKRDSIKNEHTKVIKNELKNCPIK
jgi:hypothetical protein